MVGVLCGVWRLAGWCSLTRGRWAGVWPVLVALPPFSRVWLGARWGRFSLLGCGLVCILVAFGVRQEASPLAVRSESNATAH